VYQWPGGSYLMKKNRGRKSHVRVPLIVFKTICQLHPIMRNSVQNKLMEFRGIPRNSVAFRDTEFRIIPRNFWQFRIAYGIYGSNKNIRNSVLTEFHGHPTANTLELSDFPFKSRNRFYPVFCGLFLHSTVSGKG
jgi:hypothetical protein